MRVWAVVPDAIVVQMDLYLQAVLSGQVDLQAAVEWLESDSDTCAPSLPDVVRLHKTPINPPSWSPKPLDAFTPAQLRAYILDHVREQAAPVLDAGAFHDMIAMQSTSIRNIQSDIEIPRPRRILEGCRAQRTNQLARWWHCRAAAGGGGGGGGGAQTFRFDPE